MPFVESSLLDMVDDIDDFMAITKLQCEKQLIDYGPDYDHMVPIMSGRRPGPQASSFFQRHKEDDG